jgi:amino acid adenylation domain-containing protein
MRLSDLPLLSAAERQQLAEWSRDADELSADLCVHDLIARQAERTPAAIAVEDLAGVRLTYRELEARADRLARRLARFGVGPEVLVGVAMERSAQLPVVLLAVLKAGGGYVPLDPGFPAQRLAFMQADSGLRVLLTEEWLRDRCAAGPGVRVLALDRDLEGEGTTEERLPLPPADPGRVAYVLYTSGSTGRPKGVQVVHAALASFLLSMGRRLGCAASDVLLAITTLSFDIAALELFLPLVTGGRVLVGSRDVASDGERLAAVLARPDIIRMQATPSTWRMLFGAGWQGKPGLVALCGGEALPRDLADRLLGAVGELWNLYGPTETTIWSALDRVERGKGPVAIGRPVANTRLLLLSQAAEEVPVGIAGELCIAGIGLARGYLGRPELTAERFVPDPIPVGEAGGRLYRTGDLARRLQDGRIECLGRIDSQVKVHGFRIEPGEVEVALREHPGVRQAAVATRPAAGGEPRLVAWVVAAGETPPAAAELRAFLASRLADYMVPSSFVPLEALPLTPNGKVDLRSLPSPQSVAAAVYRPPRTPVEEVLAGIWREVLEVEKVGVDDDFFDLGGHSLLAVHALARIRRIFEVEVQLRHIFQFPTVARLSETVLGHPDLRARAEQAAQVALEVAALSDAEVEALLGEGAADSLETDVP